MPQMVHVVTRGKQRKYVLKCWARGMSAYALTEKDTICAEFGGRICIAD